MTINNINIDATLEKVKKLLSEEKELSPTMRSMVELLVVLVTLLANRLNVNSSNSSKPPSSDPNRKRVRKENGEKKPGGQKGRVGVTLQKVEEPDKVEVIKIDRRKLPPGNYREAGYESRQVFDIDISRIVTEYRAQILEDGKGDRFVASFPKEVTKAVQYGMGVKAHAVYMSQFQLIPYKRVQEYFREQLGIPVSEGSIYNFNQEAFGLLESFEEKAKERLARSDLLHVDETGIAMNGERRWLHCTSNGSWTYFFPHEKRGTDAMNTIGILPKFRGILCHDHWKPYYTYDCTHALCNAHHLRELTGVWEEDKQQWAKDTRVLLEEINRAVNDAGGFLETSESEKYRQRYRSIVKNAEAECPPPDETNRKGKRGRVKRTKARNLLERLIEYENDVLRFMENEIVPFTNNLGENDIRMTKVHQKISGCFRSMEGAKIFCRIRSYLSTCRKQGVSSSQGLEILFRGELPDFV
ncbi:MAG: IS66 family transposase [Candidatus Brocadiaceae bacterium]|nr:IS66 family transposase [Candidatus Brocadiaceae bacterium]MDR4507282.1 IS66 family transposase [Candidatus Brocadiaceae bacterium]MDR4507343.1 IS66 family transposase [Candidatus Brocadiaceae bacterium]MDR4507577.1 IS66 family transposase [Candidatus Brocadiaceae bacterium]MDR4507730.1 IS66 family transposase [Candidatus Brocadiaceae bacterium]